MEDRFDTAEELRTATASAYAPPRENASIFVRSAQFFLVPFLIVSVCVGIYLLATWMVYGRKTASDLVRELRASGGQARAHVALQLASELRALRDQKTEIDLALAPQIAELLRVEREADPAALQTRQFLALCLGLLGDPSSVPVLLETLRSEEDAETKAACLEALGSIGDSSAAAEIQDLLKDGSSVVRRYCVYNLAVLSGRKEESGEPVLPGMAAPLRAMLEDPVVEVRWNTACVLAMYFGDSSGRALLTQMLDRSYVEGQIRGVGSHNLGHVLVGSETCGHCMRGSLTAHAMKMAAVSLGSLRDRETLEALRKLGSEDPDHQVRKAAQLAVGKIEG